MAIHAELKELASAEPAEDSCRLFFDGSIKTVTLTESGEMGWYVLARPVSGASKSFRRYFVQRTEGIYLRVSGPREAIALRDGMIITSVEARVRRTDSNDLRNKLI